MHAIMFESKDQKHACMLSSFKRHAWNAMLMHEIMQLQACHAWCRVTGLGFKGWGFRAAGSGSKLIGLRVHMGSRSKVHTGSCFKQHACMSSCMQSCICKRPVLAASHMQDFLLTCLQTCKGEQCRVTCRQKQFVVLNPVRPTPVYNSVWKSTSLLHGSLCLCLSVKSLC